MGIDLDVLIGHELTAEQAFALPDRLSHALPVFAALSELCTVLEAAGWRDLERRWFWHQLGLQRAHPVTVARMRELWANRDSAILDSSVGWLYIGPRLIRWMTPHKLAAFAQDADGIQAPIRRMSRALAHEFGGARVIYLPDSGANNPFVGLVNENVVLDGAVARLAARQPPACDFASLYPVRQDADGRVRGTGEFAYFVEDLGSPFAG